MSVFILPVFALTLGNVGIAQTPACPSSLVKSQSLKEIVDDLRIKNTLVVIEKHARRLGVYQNGALQKQKNGVHDACYAIALAAGYQPGPKEIQGDLKTPEGWYRSSDKPWSRFSHAIAVHYPNTQDAKTALGKNRITTKQFKAIQNATADHRKPPQNTKMGGEILIHGDGGPPDWTLGCAGLSNADILSMRALMPKNQKFWIYISP